MANCLLWSCLGKRPATWCGAGIEVCQIVRLLNRNFSVLCSRNILCWNQGSTGQEKLQAKRRPMQQHMRSMPSAHLQGKTVGERMEEWMNGVGYPLEWKEIDCLVNLDLMSHIWKKMLMNTRRDKWWCQTKETVREVFNNFPPNKHRPTIILTSMTDLHVKRDNIGIWCMK